MPTRRTFGVFSYLVHVADSKVIIGVWIRRYAFGTRYASGADSNGKFFLKYAEISLMLSAPGGIMNTRFHGCPCQAYQQ